jgi:hypothetical protein
MESHNPVMFQTTNQICIFPWYSYDIPINPNDIPILSHLVTIKITIEITNTFH